MPARVFTKIAILVCLFLISSGAYGQDTNNVPSVYQSLIARLCQDGFDPDFLFTLFSDGRADVIPDRMMISLGSKENPNWYTPFLQPDSIHLAKSFLIQNLKFLRKVERQFKVDKEVIVAILLVESKFGENAGRHRVIPTLASMAIIDREDNLVSNYLILKELDPELSFDCIENSAKRRAAWAYHELKCFLTIIRDEKIDPLDIKGSYAGAVGMAQFIPSSYLSFALSKKSFENWMSSKDEAILSIANYLKLSGWRKNLSGARKRKILWFYNHSDPYIDTVLQIADRIKQK